MVRITKHEQGWTVQGFAADRNERIDGTVEVIIFGTKRKKLLYVPSEDGKNFAELLNGILIGWVSELPRIENHGTKNWLMM